MKRTVLLILFLAVSLHAEKLQQCRVAVGPNEVTIRKHFAWQPCALALIDGMYLTNKYLFVWIEQKRTWPLPPKKTLLRSKRNI